MYIFGKFAPLFQIPRYISQQIYTMQHTFRQQHLILIGFYSYIAALVYLTPVIYTFNFYVEHFGKLSAIPQSLHLPMPKSC